MDLGGLLVQIGFIEDNPSIVAAVLAIVTLVVVLGVLKLRSVLDRRTEQAAGQSEKISCPRCGELNPPDEDTCPSCNRDLTSL